MGFAGRLYRAETNAPLVARRKWWYAASAVILLICVLSFIVRGFNFGIEFEGGNQYQISANSSTSLQEFADAVTAADVTVETQQEAGSGSQKSYIIRTPSLDAAANERVKESVAKRLNVPAADVSDSHISSSWGSDISTKALRGMIIFLIAVAGYLAIRYEWRMAVSAMVALIHDLILTAGIYSLVGFEVNPSTIVGLLTILGYSLYDTVVVFDKVAENTAGLLSGARMTYADAANKAVNETLMRSINTSLISLLPVAGLLFVGAGLLGVGTLKDLALVLFVGLATGAYSSIFLATPLLVDLKNRDPRIQALAKRVETKRQSTKAAPAGAAAAEPTPRRTTTAVLERPDDDDSPAVEPPPARRPGSVPKPGARPGRSGVRPKPSGSRPASKRKKRR